MDLHGKFWYSQKQREVIDSFGHPHRNFAQLSNGEIVRYTEWKSGKHINEPCNWDDAKLLGEGTYHHTD